MLADQETGPSTGSTKRKAADMGPSDFGTRPAKSLSVIVPTCNNANVVARTLRSVEDAVAFLRGRPKYADFGSEVVVVDDGSQDGTRQAVEEWTRGKSLYKVVLRSESSSPSCSRNTGAACSTGDLLFFLDGDDVFLERHLFDCVDAFDRDGEAAFVKTGVELSDPVHPTWKDRVANSLVITLAVRRRCHELVGGFPDVHLFERRGDVFNHRTDVFRMFEDVFYNKLLATFFRGVGLAAETVRYHRYPGNAFDRQYARFQMPVGEHGDDLDDEGRFRVKLCHILMDRRIQMINKKVFHDR